MTTDHVKRRKVVEELVSTERAYVNMLFKLFDNVIKPFQAVLFAGQHGFPTKAEAKAITANSKKAGAPAAGKFISPEDFDTVFQGCTHVLEANKLFFPQIAQKLTLWTDSETIGDVFVQWSHYFKLYKFYCKHFDTASHVFAAAVNRSKKFAQFIDDVMPRMNYQTVQSIMISPIQRIPRYLLLLKELLKCTGPEHPDATLLTQALRAMSDTASALDQSLSVQESALELFCVVTKFRPIPQLQHPTPGLVRMAPLAEHTREKPQHLTAVLLRDGTMLLGGHTGAQAAVAVPETKRRRYV